MGTIVRTIKDILFPIFCVACRKEGEWWCESCWKPSLSTETKFFYATPGTPPSGLTAITTLFDYQNCPAARKLIHDFKYRLAREVSEVWLAIISQVIQPVRPSPNSFQPTKSQFLASDDGQSISIIIDHATLPTVIPIPLFPRRARERGFNQAAIIAELIATHCHLPIDSTGLKRLRPTINQATLSKEERLENVINAFAWRGAEPPSETILLVDDVYTTGATMQACAEKLRQAGAKTVYGLALARD